jgi:hypothetical protein
MAWGQASPLRAQQTSPNPAGPALGQKSATAMPPAPIPPPDFRTHNRSHLQLNRGNRTFDVFLYAPDEKTEVLDVSSFFGRKGARQFSGHYQLISVAGNDVLSKLDLDPDDSFVENKPHDGLRLVLDPRSNQNLIALFQYGNSNSESVQFFSLDPSGRLFLISFLERDGRVWKQKLTGPEGAIPQTAEGDHLFCSYVNTVGYVFCDAYSFDGENFQESAKWMTQDYAAPARGMNDEGLAARTLFDFLSALSAGEYAAAAFYLEPHLNPGGTQLSAHDRAHRAKFLEDYCSTLGGQCFLPNMLEAKTVADAPSAFRFQVSLLNSDFRAVKIGDRSTFEFRVAKTAGGFKVLDLPPQIPTSSKQ